MEGIFLSVNDQYRYRVIEDFREGRLSRHDVALKLGLSERQVTRITKKIRKNGIPGLVHGNRAKRPHNKYSADLIEWCGWGFSWRVVGAGIVTMFKKAIIEIVKE